MAFNNVASLGEGRWKSEQTKWAIAHQCHPEQLLQGKENKMENPPAFPTNEKIDNVLRWNSGMTLREYFAGQALVSMQAHPANERPDSIANWCFKVADAMLAERSKTSPQTSEREG